MHLPAEKPTPRNSNLELLRIVSMFMIVVHHYSTHGGFWFSEAFSLNEFWVQLLAIGGKVGVNCFVLISGYFLCKETHFKWRRIFYFALQVTLYSIILYISSLLINGDSFSTVAFAKACLPLPLYKWWFASTYFVFLLIAPLLAMFIGKIDQKLHLKIVLLLGFIWCVVPTVTTSAFEGNDLLWFVCLFFFAAYLRKYPCAFLQNRKKTILLGLGAYGFIVLSILCLDLMGASHNQALYFTAQNKLPLVLLSLSLFCLFLGIPKFSNRTVNVIANSMFGVYLIHDDLRNFIWKTLLQNAAHGESTGLYLHSIVSSVLVFAGCLVLSFLFNLFFEKPLKKLSEALEKGFRHCYEKFF